MTTTPPKPKASRQSLFGINAVNFFLAELSGVVGPFLAVYLKQTQWNYAHVGWALSAGTLGTLLFQTPAGFICDVVKWRKLLLAFMSGSLGACFAILPTIASHLYLTLALLFLTGVIGAFFAPLLASLALGLVGVKGFSEETGENQGWNHAGNIAAALVGLFVVRYIHLAAIFYVTTVLSALAIVSLMFIKSSELNPNLGLRRAKPKFFSKIAQYLRNREIVIFLLSLGIFHIANAPLLPLVSLYIKHVGGADDKIAVAVLISQAVMIPVAYLSGKYCDRLGRKPVFAAAYIILPIRIWLYTTTSNTTTLLAIQAFDGLGAGVYGVLIALICRDLSKGQGFNLLVGVAQTALAIGGLIGPLLQGYLLQFFDFKMTFYILAGIALLAALIFLIGFRETKTASAG